MIHIDCITTRVEMVSISQDHSTIKRSQLNLIGCVGVGVMEIKNHVVMSDNRIHKSTTFKTVSLKRRKCWK